MTQTVAKKALDRALPGVANLLARKLYRSIKRHYQYEACPSCTFYKKYGTAIINGPFTEHILVINGGKFAASDLFKLKDTGLIELVEISARQYRLTIVELAPQETLA